MAVSSSKSEKKDSWPTRLLRACTQSRIEVHITTCNNPECDFLLNNRRSSSRSTFNSSADVYLPRHNQREASSHGSCRHVRNNSKEQKERGRSSGCSASKNAATKDRDKSFQHNHHSSMSMPRKHRSSRHSSPSVSRKRRTSNHLGIKSPQPPEKVHFSQTCGSSADVMNYKDSDVRTIQLPVYADSELGRMIYHELGDVLSGVEKKAHAKPFHEVNCSEYSQAYSYSSQSSATDSSNASSGPLSYSYRSHHRQ